MFGLRELLCIADAQHHIRVEPVLWIEEWIAPDRDPWIGLGDLAELHPDVAFARIRAHRFRQDTKTDLELRRHVIEHRLHDRGHARHHDYIADPEAGRPRHLVENEVSALGDARQAGAYRSSPRRWDMDPWDTQVQILIMQAKYSLTNLDYNFSAPTYF